MMIRLNILLFFMVPLWSAFATPQEGDTLVIESNGKIITVHTMRLPKQAVEALDKIKKPTSSANWRGYRVNMKLSKSHLYITSVTVLAGDLSQRAVPMKTLFGSKGPFKADWFTGELAEYFGESMGYTHAKKKVRVHYFEKGKYIGTKTMDSLEYHQRDKKKAANKKSDQE